MCPQKMNIRGMSSGFDHLLPTTYLTFTTTLHMFHESVYKGKQFAEVSGVQHCILIFDIAIIYDPPSTASSHDIQRNKNESQFQQ